MHDFPENYGAFGTAVMAGLLIFTVTVCVQKERGVSPWHEPRIVPKRVFTVRVLPPKPTQDRISAQVDHRGF